MLDVFLNNICCQLIVLLEVGNFFGTGHCPMVGVPHSASVEDGLRIFLSACFQAIEVGCDHFHAAHQVVAQRKDAFCGFLLRY